MPTSSSSCPRLIVFLLAVLALSVPGRSARADDWPQWLGPKRDGVWRETGILDKFPSGGPRVLWRTKIGGGYAGPAVADGRVYVTDRQLEAGARDPEDPFARTASQGKERVLCLDAANGKVIWSHEYDCKYQMAYPCGPRTTPVVHDGKVYALGGMGDLCCLDAASGKPVWARNFMRDYKAPLPLWGFAAHPLLDGDKLICLVGGEGSVVVAFDRRTGAEIWKSLSLEHSELGYCPPMIYTVGGRRQLIIWHPESVNGLDPETGKPYWSVPFTSKANLSISTPRLEGNRLFITSFYNGALMLELDADKPAARVLWKGRAQSELPQRTDTLHSIISTPVLKDGTIYGVGSYGELRGLRTEDGKRLWMSLQPTCPDGKPTRWANAFLIPQGDRFFLPNEKGDLIIARLSPKGYEEIDRAHILEPTGKAMGRRVVWSHPAFANKCMFARNDKEIVCVSLAAK
jgi:outer membrane protein assembly factor BamB